MSVKYRYVFNPTNYTMRIENSTQIEPEKVIFNDPATIVFWNDGTKTVVKCQEGDIYDEQTGLLMCIAKKFFGNNGRFNDILREWVPEKESVVDWQRFIRCFGGGCQND